MIDKPKWAEQSSSNSKCIVVVVTSLDRAKGGPARDQYHINSRYWSEQSCPRLYVLIWVYLLYELMVHSNIRLVQSYIQEENKYEIEEDLSNVRFKDSEAQNLTNRYINHLIVFNLNLNFQFKYVKLSFETNIWTLNMLYRIKKILINIYLNYSILLQNLNLILMLIELIKISTQSFNSLIHKL